MKKFIAAFLSLSLLASMASCASTTSSSQASTAVPASSASPVSSEPSTYTITLPASLFQGQSIDDAIANAKKEGVGEVTKNDDGSVTYKMNKATHDQLTAAMKQSMQTTLDSIKSGENFKSIKDIKCNDKYSEITLIVDQASFENGFDGFALLGIYIAAAYYNIFSGSKPEDTKITFKIEDQATQKVFKTVVYPDDIKSAASSSK